MLMQLHKKNPYFGFASALFYVFKAQISSADKLARMSLKENGVY